MKILLSLILIFSLSIAPVARAQGHFPEVTDKEAELNALAFMRTKEICSQINSLNREMQVDWAMVKFAIDGFKGGVSLWGRDIVQTSSDTQALIKSNGYQMALDECYKDDQLSRDALTWAILAADAGGHILGYVTWLIPFQFLGKLFAGGRLALAYPRFFAGMAAASGYVQKIALVGAGTYLGWQQYAQYKIRNNTKDKLSELNDQMVESTAEQAQATFDLLQKALDKINMDLAIGLKDEGRRQRLMATKTALEERLSHRYDPPPSEDDVAIQPR